MNFRGVQEGHTWSTIHFLLIIQKTEKVQEHDLFINQILHHFDLKKFPRMSNKKFTKRGPRGQHKYFFTKRE